MAQFRRLRHYSRLLKGHGRSLDPIVGVSDAMAKLRQRAAQKAQEQSTKIAQAEAKEEPEG